MSDRRDGSYLGGNGDLYVELRVEVSAAGTLSADVYRSSSHGRDYVASVRSAPGTRAAVGDRIWPAIWRDGLGATSTGAIRVRGADGEPGALTATLVTDQRLGGLPARTSHMVVARRAGGGPERAAALPGSLEDALDSDAPTRLLRGYRSSCR